MLRMNEKQFVNMQGWNSIASQVASNAHIEDKKKFV